MNVSTPLGFIVGGIILTWAIQHGIKNPAIFLSPHAAAIVIGGTAAAALICFPLSHFINMFKIFFLQMIGRAQAEAILTINEVVRLSQIVNDGRPITGEFTKIKNPFLRESLELLESGGLTEDELYEVLDKRVEFQNDRYRRESLTFKIIGKFPPAFGLIGTTMGMIALLQGLGSPDAFEQIGPSMSIALVATFYGLILANIILIPVGESLNRASEEDLVIRRIVVDGVRLLKEQKHPLLVSEYLKSYLAPSQRKRMSKVQA